MLSMITSIHTAHQHIGSTSAFSFIHNDHYSSHVVLLKAKWHYILVAYYIAYKRTYHWDSSGQDNKKGIKRNKWHYK